MRYWKSWHYKSLTLFFLGTIFSIVLFKNDAFQALLLRLDSWGYFGIFLSGMLFVASLTASTGIVILIVLAKTFSSLEIAVIAGLGAIAGDYIILRLFRDNILNEIKPLYLRLGGEHITKVFYKKPMRWALPIIGAIIIASPLPDEIGISLMGISEIKTYQFILLSFILNSTGIFLLVSAFSLIK